MSKFHETLRARELRRTGQAINKIAQTLGVSKASVSIWCRDLELTPEQQELLRKNAIAGGHKGRMVGAAMNRCKKEQMVAHERSRAAKMVGTLSKRDLFMLGLGLYWGEGVKSSGTRVSMVNSDPSIIVLMKRWFMECLGVTEERFRPVIFINAIHRPREEVLLAFWSRELGLPPSQFAKTVFLKKAQKKVYENYDSYYGIMALQVSRPAELKYRILGMLERLTELK